MVDATRKPGRKRMSLADRLEHYTCPEPMSGCWLWTGALTRDGYGYIGLRPIGGKPHNVRAHRLSYEMHVGPIPDDLVIDHLCRVRCCVNPDHLEVVTQQENVWRSPIHATLRAQCTSGHARTEDNTVWFRPTGNYRLPVCLDCRNES